MKCLFNEHQTLKSTAIPNPHLKLIATIDWILNLIEKKNFCCNNKWIIPKIDIEAITCCSKLCATLSHFSKRKDILKYSKSMEFVNIRCIFFMMLIKKRKDTRNFSDFYSKWLPVCGHKQSIKVAINQ